ncbi:efflux RND transporter periplasmic adaptor subunit [Mucilaginibacter paludis]|uniref:Efflux transporter, RND family, MFP subunit n=1 Tax=Mucilaginibacter paludis DSM 18603 TaxID=714943 RepID=H1Y362_9SPHI|nr:efflux RND transporter periplasmic adaptor subunit [Mucilaginibacter paludis]EHQ28880.1 efflux transporter, RND family, MFP subunit [Mucilaginibacter paludis DSM 18603]
MNHFNTLLTGSSLLLLISIGGCSGNKSQTPKTDTIRVQAINLNTASATSGNQLVYNGTLQADKAVDLSFQVSGTINSFPVQTGDYVKKGQLVATVDETTYRNQYNAQMAQAKLAEENYKRTLAVFEKGSVAEIKMLEAKANYEQASSSARATYQNIAHTRLYAPQSGFIGEKRTEAGAISAPGQPVAQLLDTHSVDVLVAVPENEINLYKAGNRALVKIDALGNQPLEGRISEVGVLALNNSANYNIKVKLANAGQELRPGMLCKVTFPAGTAGKAAQKSNNEIVVPLEAVQVDESGHNFVYVIASGNKAQRKQVETGALYNNGMAINSGLTGNEQLITSGFQKLADQSPVTLIK